MAEADFERRLERLFGEAPELPDSQAFAERIEQRLNRGWTALWLTYFRFHKSAQPARTFQVCNKSWLKLAKRSPG